MTMSKNITIRLPIVLGVAIIVLGLFSVLGVALWQQHQSNKDLTAEVNRETKLDNQNGAMYLEVAERLADLQFYLGTPQKIGYQIPYTSEFYKGDPGSAYMFPALYSRNYVGMARCDYGQTNVGQDIIKECQDNASNLFHAWNP
jgi:hypothetical protein